MKIRLAAPLQPDSVVDGYGIRTVLWTQGCSHNCPFCQNPQTHDFNGGYEEELDNIFEELKSLQGQDGITLSGGDPLFQIEASLEIAKYSKSIGLNVWCYSGFTYEQIYSMGNNNPLYREFLNNIDVLVDGKFEIENKSMSSLFRGSSNQRLIDTKKSLECGYVVTLEETDGIMESFQVKEKIYI